MFSVFEGPLFLSLWLRSSSPSYASRTTRGARPSSSWSRWWKNLRPSFLPTSSPRSLWTSPLCGTSFSLVLFHFVWALTTSQKTFTSKFLIVLFRTITLSRLVSSAEPPCPSTKPQEIRQKCVLIPAEGASVNFPFIRFIMTFFCVAVVVRPRAGSDRDSSKMNSWKN